MKYMSVYLNFNGNAQEAFDFYRSAFGGEFSFVMRFRETPDGNGLPEADRDKLMHISLPIRNGMTLLGSDVPGSFGQKVEFGTGQYIYLETDSVEEADRLFGALSVGMVPEMPMQNTFWGSYFGSFADRYGVKWMVSYTAPTVAGEGENPS